jgi:phosphatidylserine/phosphatidylglycerophosphate/cardiolipin synthase-like enzyme
MNAISTISTRATADDWAQFLKPVAMAVRNTPNDAEFRARVAAVTHAVAVPAEWLRQPWRQADAMRRFQFWPAVYDVAEMFADDLRAERESAERRQRLAPPEPGDDWLNVPLPEEVAAVQAKARALIAELTGTSPDHRGPPPKALPLSEGVLLARYERQAEESHDPDLRRLAAIRAEHIRNRIGADE